MTTQHSAALEYSADAEYEFYNHPSFNYGFYFESSTVNASSIPLAADPPAPVPVDTTVYDAALLVFAACVAVLVMTTIGYAFSQLSRRPEVKHGPRSIRIG